MGIRDAIGNNSAVVTTMAVILLGVSLAVLVFQNRGGGSARAADVYYYDLDADQFFVAHSDLLPPIETPYGGHRGVRAGLYGCSACPDGLAGKSMSEVEQSGVFVVYFERYTDEAKQVLGRMHEPDAGDDLLSSIEDAKERGHMVRRPHDTEWRIYESGAGVRIVSDGPLEHCSDGQRPVRCRP